MSLRNRTEIHRWTGHHRIVARVFARKPSGTRPTSRLTGVRRAFPRPQSGRARSRSSQPPMLP
eukprot:3561475-Pleurochrysis_carterae.AAC.1